MQILNNAELAFLSLLTYPRLTVKSLKLCASNAVLFPKGLWPHLSIMWESYLALLAKNRQENKKPSKDAIAASLLEAVQSDQNIPEEIEMRCEQLLQRFITGDVPPEDEGIVFVQKVAQMDANRKIMASISKNADFQALESVINKAKQDVDSLTKAASTTKNQVVWSPLRDIEQLATVQKRIPTGINFLDEITSGGGREGELWVILGGSGQGKCLHPDTPVLMYDGRIKKAKEVTVGDQLMGPDSTPRNVLALGNGRSTMYKIIPIKGDPYIVNKHHILTLVNSTARDIIWKGQRYHKGDLIDIAVEDYLQLSNKRKKALKGVRTGVDFPPIPDPVYDPYFVGVYLGDGTRNKAQLTLSDDAVIQYCKNYCESIGCRVTITPYKDEACSDVSIASKSKDDRIGFRPRFLPYVINEKGNKYIHPSYKYGSQQVRRAILAGLLDTDGYLNSGFYEICTKFDELAEDIVFLARSLGFATRDLYCRKTCCNTGASGMYHRIYISGDFIDIPTIRKGHEPFKRRLNKDVLHTGISIEQLPEGDYCGFVIDGDHRFLLGDFTITHNTSLTVQYACEQALMGQSVLWVTLEQSAAGDIAERIIANVTNESLDRIRDRGFSNLDEDIQRKFWASVAGADDKLIMLDFTQLTFNPDMDPKDNGGMYSVWQQFKKLKAEGKQIKTVIIDWLGAMMSVIGTTTGKSIDTAFGFQIAAQAEIDIARQMCKEEGILIILFHQTDTKSQHARPTFIPDRTCALNMRTLANFADICITLSNRDAHNILYMSAVKSRKGNTISKPVRLIGDKCKFVNAPGWLPNTDGNFYNPAEVTLNVEDVQSNEPSQFSREIE